MKKLITIIMILALILPAVAMASPMDNTSWYMYVDYSKYPEVQEQYGLHDHGISILTFLADHTVIRVEYRIKDSKISLVSITYGTWEHMSNLRYKYNIEGLGEGVVKYNRDLYVYLPGSSTDYAIYKKLVKFDFETDYVRN